MALPFERFQSALTDVPGAYSVGVVRVAASQAEKQCLSLSIARMGMSALGALLAGLLRWHRYQPTTGPLGLVVELTAEFSPPLI